MRLPPIFCTDSQERIPPEYFAEGKAVWCNGKPYLTYFAKQLGLRYDSVPPAKFAALEYYPQKASATPPSSYETPRKPLAPPKPRGKTQRLTQHLQSQSAVETEMRPPPAPGQAIGPRTSILERTIVTADTPLEPPGQAPAQGTQATVETRTKTPSPVLSAPRSQAGPDTPGSEMTVATASVNSEEPAQAPEQSASAAATPESIMVSAAKAAFPQAPTLSESALADQLKETLPSGKRGDQIAAELRAASEARFTAETAARALAEARKKAEAAALAKARAEAAQAQRREAAEALACAKAEARAEAAALARARAEEAQAQRREAAEALARAKAGARAKASVEAKARAEAEEKLRVRAEAGAKAKAEAEARAREGAQAREKAAAEARARASAAARARAEAETNARAQAEERARIEAEARARAEAESRAQAEAEASARAEAEAKGKAEAERRAREEAEAQAKAELQAIEQIEAEARARIEAAAKARTEAQMRARERAEARAKAEAEARAQAAAAAKAKAEAVERARVEAAARAKAEAEAKAREAAVARARAEAEAKAREEAEERERAEAEAQAKEAAAAAAQAEAEARAREEAEARAREEAEAREHGEAEARAREEAEALERAEAEAKAQEEAEAREREEAERRAREEAEAREREEAALRAREEAEARAREEAERRAREEAEAREREEAELRAREEAEARARAEADAKAQAEEEARAEAEGRAREQAARQAKLAAAGDVVSTVLASEHRKQVLEALRAPGRAGSRAPGVAPIAMGPAALQHAAADSGERLQDAQEETLEATMRLTPAEGKAGESSIGTGGASVLEAPPVVGGAGELAQPAGALAQPAAEPQQGDSLPPTQLTPLPGLEGLSEAQMMQLYDASARRVFKKGETVCCAGDKGFTAFFLISGKAEIWLPGVPQPHERDARGTTGVSPVPGSGQYRHCAYIPIDGPVDLEWDRPIAELQAGELLGEMTCLANLPRSATVCATTDCVVLELLPQALLMLREHKPFRERIEKTYRERALKQHLRNIPVLRGIDDEFLAQLCAKAQLLEFPAGTVILKPAIAGFAGCTYVIRVGSVKASRREGDAGRTTEDRAELAQARPAEAGVEGAATYLRRGQSFGALAPLESGGLGATYKTMTLVSAARITWQDIDELLARPRPQAQQAPEGQTCENCADPRCLTDCAVGGIQRTPAGTITFDESCIGCGACVENCPSGQIALEPAAGAGQDGPRKAVRKDK